jgi:CTP synthase (UTP-ammonia lyase)
MTKKIGIVGDFHNSITQSTIADSIEHSCRLLGCDMLFDWIDTEKLDNNNYADLLQGLNGIWSAPGSPFKSLNGAINAIRFARERKIPHLGTCAGYQHTIIEYARNVSGFKNAQHAEYSPDLDNQFISKMSCSLKGTKDSVTLLKDSIVGRIYDSKEIEGNYFCSYGLNTDYKSVFEQSDFLVSGNDSENAIRILELKNHPFFIVTVFVPQVDSSFDKPNPLITEFVRVVNTN